MVGEYVEVGEGQKVFSVAGAKQHVCMCLCFKQKLLGLGSFTSLKSQE